MEFILQPTQNLSQELMQQIKSNVPRSGLKEDLLNNLTDDPRVQFANNQTSALLLDDNVLQSFCSIGQDEIFNKSISESLSLDSKETITLIYLFTPDELQWKWNARTLIESIANNIKTKMPYIKQIVRTTSTAYNRDLYLSYGAKLVTPKQNINIKDLWIEKDYFFIYSI